MTLSMRLMVRHLGHLIETLPEKSPSNSRRRQVPHRIDSTMVPVLPCPRPGWGGGAGCLVVLGGRGCRCGV